MKTLMELDKVKQRMLLSQTALKEADNWSTLSENVEEVFATRDIQQVPSYPPFHPLHSTLLTLTLTHLL